MTESQTYKRTRIVVLVCAWTVLASSASAQQDGNGNKPVTREEFRRFLEEYKQLKTDVAELQEENRQLRQEVTGLQREDAVPQQIDWNAEFENRIYAEREVIMDRVRDEFGPTIDSLSPGFTNFVVGGAAVVTYQDRENRDSTFGLGIAPLLLWSPTERLLLEAEFGFSLSEERTEVELGLAQLNYFVNDYITVGAGLFRNPFLTFWERWHPSWINKAANIPLIYERGLVGPAGLGVQIRGGAPIGSTSKVNYSFYYVNGPKFETSQVSAGRLDFNNYRDNNNNKGFGGRIGFLPVPELEIGYSFFTGKVGDSGSDFSRVDTFMHGVDFTYAHESEAIRGRLDLRAEAVWIDTDNVVFTGLFNPFTFDNKRSGWFVQAAYRPTLVDYAFGSDLEMKNFEFVVRYDQVREPGPGRLGADRDRLTLGVDYWIRPNAVVKAAYSYDNVKGSEDEDGFFLQFAVGF